MKPQNAAVLALLRAHPEGVTQLQALYAVGTFRLGARVWDLRHDGYHVETEWQMTDKGQRIARYRLHEEVAA